MMCASWIVLVAWLLHTMTAFENGDLDRRMTVFAQFLAQSASGAAGDPETLARHLQDTERTFVQGVIETLENAAGYRASYQVFDAGGRLLYRTGLAPSTPMTLESGVSLATREDGQRWRLARVGSPDGAVTVVVGERELDRWDSIWPVLRIIGVGQILMLSVALLVSGWATLRGIRPLHVLARNIALRKAGDAAPVTCPVVYEEIAPMLRELNALLDRESRRIESERGFLADAAHELRTPLAAIGTQAHLLAGATDTEERRRLANSLEAGLERVSHLLRQLLTIARVDAPGARFERVRTDVASLVRERLAELSQIARARAIGLDFECPETLFAEVNPPGFVSVVDNLVDNAIRYAPSAGQVHVQLARRDDALEFTVRDNGPGIAPEERERVFERFYRIPGVSAPGSGLGLAIVERIVRAHDASIAFVDGIAGAGIGVRVILNLRSASPP